jgi:hypothetical protein
MSDTEYTHFHGGVFDAQGRRKLIFAARDLTSAREWRSGRKDAVWLVGFDVTGAEHDVPDVVPQGGALSIMARFKRAVGMG